MVKPIIPATFDIGGFKNPFPHLKVAKFLSEANQLEFLQKLHFLQLNFLPRTSGCMFSATELFALLLLLSFILT